MFHKGRRLGSALDPIIDRWRDGVESRSRWRGRGQEGDGLIADANASFQNTAGVGRLGFTYQTTAGARQVREGLTGVGRPLRNEWYRESGYYYSYSIRESISCAFEANQLGLLRCRKRSLQGGRSKKLSLLHETFKFQSSWQAISHQNLSEDSITTLLSVRSLDELVFWGISARKRSWKGSQQRPLFGVRIHRSPTRSQIVKLIYD